MGIEPFIPCSPWSPLSPGDPGGPGGPATHISSPEIRIKKESKLIVKCPEN